MQCNAMQSMYVCMHACMHVCMYVTTKDMYIYNIHVHCISLYDVIQIIPTPQALSKAEEAWSNIEAREELVNHLKDGGKGSLN